ncbi:CstA-like transporter-associated (seleno)protein [Sphingomonas naphthae]|uniref:CstA-like transporter-associated (Seleno)protein n=1 Tax=Sphingomonas naphthae TaxID=1813468 RepID=A0ABY7TG10_9SPHN|nr:CstA-like transporter-associated (seleno)protein [Sphingomonas naphthae]WCT72095.1 CstA-like transporter-associated (seleno)protein [Sphingomonas naphthae]
MIRLWARLRETARLMVGVPSYDAYRAHMAEHHPEATPLTRVAFFRDRQEARYGGKNGGRCC